MKHRIVADKLVHEFRLLRNRLEAELQGPSLIFVTSATDHDGASLMAYGLAESLSKTRQRVTLVTTDTTIVAPEPSELAPQATLRRRASDRLTDSSVHPSGDGRFCVVAISAERVTTISKTNIADMVTDLRSANDYVIIDAGNLPKSSFALMLISSADAALITFRSGRSQQTGDRVMLDALERCETKILGVVMTDEAAIEHFHQRDDQAIAKLQPVVEQKFLAGLSERFEVAISRRGKSM